MAGFTLKSTAALIAATSVVLVAACKKAPPEPPKITKGDAWAINLQQQPAPQRSQPPQPRSGHAPRRQQSTPGDRPSNAPASSTAAPSNSCNEATTPASVTVVASAAPVFVLP